MSGETRNIIDHFHYWKHEAIKAELDSKRHNFSVLISNQFQDFNIGTCVRNNNAFLGKEILVYGHKRFDRRGTVGTHLYENLRHLPTVEDVKIACQDKIIVCIDNTADAEPIEDFVWPTQHVVMVFGQEQVGIPQELLAIADKKVYIRQYGSVRSLNVGSASAIAMYDYCKKMGG